MPAGPAQRPGRSEAESIDDTEHGTSIIGAMVARLDLVTELACVLPAERRSVREPIFAERMAHASDRVNVHTGDAVLLHELGSQTAICDTTNDGVNDPVRAPWGHVQGTTAGSFTPSLVQ